MSAFDSHINVIDWQILAPEEDEIPEGQDPNIVIQMMVGLVIPVPTPSGLQPAAIPFGVFKAPISDPNVVDGLISGLEEGKKILKDRSALKDFTIASSMSEAEQAAARLDAAARGR